MQQSYGDANGITFLNDEVAIALVAVKVFEWVLYGDGFDVKLGHPWQHGFSKQEFKFTAEIGFVAVYPLCEIHAMIKVSAFRL